jgi:hypothetical protein
LRTKGLFNKGYCYAREAAVIAKPIESLFTDENAYSWRVLDEIAVNGYWCDQLEDAYRAAKRILEKEKEIPESEVPRVRKNMEFIANKFLQKIK